MLVDVHMSLSTSSGHMTMKESKHTSKQQQQQTGRVIDLHIHRPLPPGQWTYLRDSDPAAGLKEVLHVSPTFGHGEFGLQRRRGVTPVDEQMVALTGTTLTTAGEGTWMLGTERGLT